MQTILVRVLPFVLVSLVLTSTHDANPMPTCHNLQAVQGFQSGLSLGGEPAKGNELQDRVLRWSFEKKLSAAAQNMFMDCITVMEGEAYDLATEVWEAWWPQQAYTAFKRLQQLSFVSVHDGMLVVQDVIRSIGRSILLDNSSRFAGSRIWEGPDRKPLGHMQVGL